MSVGCRRARRPSKRVLVLLLALAACTDQPSPGESEPRHPGNQELGPGAVTFGSSHHAASFAPFADAPAFQVGPGVPEADAEALQRLMRESGFQVKSIERVAPGEYTVHAWGCIPHAASEFRFKRDGAGWRTLRQDSWVLIGG